MLPQGLLQSNWQNIEWVNNLECMIKQICELTGFAVEKIEDKSRFGLVIYGIYNKNNSVLKIIPPDEKGRKEILYMQKSKSKIINKPLISDIKYGYYIMRKGDCQREISDIDFLELLNEIISHPEEEQNDFTYYEEELDKYIYWVRKENEDTIIKMLMKAKEIFKECFSDKQHFLLHGDVRRDNMIYFNDKLMLIDPIGVNAPIEFSILRYLEDVIFDIDNYKFFYQELYKQLNCLCNLGLERENIKNALLIDSIIRTSSSFLMKEDKFIVQKGINNFRWIYRNEM